MKCDNNKAKHIVKYIIKVVLMYSCFVLGLVCYRGGFGTYIIIATTSVFLAYFGYKTTFRIIDMLFIHINLLFSVYLGSRYATTLYYLKVSSDDMSLIIGDIFMWLSLGLTLVAIVLFTTNRIIKLMRAKRENSSY